MIAADRKSVAVATEEEHVKIGPGETNPARQRDGATVNKVCPVAVDEIREARRTTDSGKRDNLFVLEIAFLEEFVKRGEHSKVATTGAPRRVVGGDCFLGQFLARLRCRSGGYERSGRF